jgi:hypothetical protein
MKLRITVAIVAMLASVGAASARPVTEEDLLDNYLYDLAFAASPGNRSSPTIRISTMRRRSFGTWRGLRRPI